MTRLTRTTDIGKSMQHRCSWIARWTFDHRYRDADDRLLSIYFQQSPIEYFIFRECCPQLSAGFAIFSSHGSHLALISNPRALAMAFFQRTIVIPRNYATPYRTARDISLFHSLITGGGC